MEAMSPMKRQLVRMAEQKRLAKQRKAVEETVTKLMGPGNYQKYRDNLAKRALAENVNDALRGMPTTMKLGEVEDFDAASDIEFFLRKQGSTVETFGEIAELARSVMADLETANHKLAATPKIRNHLEAIEKLKADYENIE